MYTFKNVSGHVEVYYNGKFLFTADTYEEAQEEVETLKEKGEL